MKGKRKDRIGVILVALAMCLVMCACGSGLDSDGSGGTAKIPEFKSYDLEGNEVDNSIFSNADINVINVWGTFCDPCKDEMPELAEWDADMPDNVQIIGVICDVPDLQAAEYSDAQKIVEEKGVKYTNIIAAGELADYMKNVRLVPTTLFVDKNGEFIHRPFVGADVEGYKSVVKSLIG